MKTSRREFVKLAMASGIALSVSRLAVAAEPGFAARETLPGRRGWNPAATGMGRVDGVAKVTGAKLYASDFRAADLPGWPSKTAHAMLLRAADATHIYAGLDLSALPGALQPSVVVTAADLARTGIRVPEYYAGDLLCPVGKTPLYLGQPVALLIFEDFDTFDQARLALRDASFREIRGGNRPRQDAQLRRLSLHARRRPDARGARRLLAVQERLGQSGAFRGHRASRYGRGSRSRPGKPMPKPRTMASRSGLNSRRTIRRFWCWTANSRPSRSTRCFSSRKAALPGSTRRARTSSFVVGSQSPYEVASAVAYLLGEAEAAVKPARINTNSAYCGGGFGGRDHTPFPLYVALAAMFFPDRPVRLANNRYEQFQSGIKRHAFKIRTRMGVDRATGKIVGFAADHALDGGGLANFSVNVATVSANMAVGIYYVPKVDITTYAFHSRGVTAGSMRGYGTVQSTTALEVMVDEICTALPLDPIEFRRRNALATGGRIMAGNTYSVSIRTPEILDKLEKHPIWSQRAEEKARGQQAGILVGTGVACASKNYGTGGDTVLGTVEIAPDGLITIRCDATEIGNAVGTAAANRIATHLGGVADEVALAQVDAFGPLDLVTSGDSYAISQETQDAAARNPRWVPSISSATAASTGAFAGTHAAAEAARVIFRFGLWPAALELWGVAPSDPRAGEWAKARWKDGQLVMPGLVPLTLAAVAAKAHARNGVTGAMAHGFNRWAWSQATFTVDGQEWTADIDALAVRRGGGDFVRLDRTSVKFPPTVFNQSGPTYATLCGTVVRVEIDRATGALRIAKAYSVLECGQALVPEVVLGQAQGGFAMGVGYALLETLPLYEDGPGNGKWNLGQYLVARGSDLPLDAARG